MSIRLPADLAERYRPATDHDVCAESFGVLKVARLHAEEDWRKQKGSFDDQAIFGPVRRFVCACGKYDGFERRDRICYVCGVKVTTPEVRRSRCAHIALPGTIPHPLGAGDERLSVLPVLPAAFVEAPGGSALLRAYAHILAEGTERDRTEAFEALIAVLMPVLITADRWALADRGVIAFGMALKDRADSALDLEDN